MKVLHRLTRKSKSEHEHGPLIVADELPKISVESWCDGSAGHDRSKHWKGVSAMEKGGLLLNTEDAGKDRVDRAELTLALNEGKSVITGGP